MTNAQSDSQNQSCKSTRFKFGTLISVLLIAGCDDVAKSLGIENAFDPNFQSIEDQCSTLDGSLTNIGLPPLLDNDGDPIQALDTDGNPAVDGDGNPVFDVDLSVAASTQSGDYKLYLEDILTALEPSGNAPTASADNLTVIDEIKTLINDTFNFNYEIVNGEVIRSTNALDYIESLANTPGTVGAFDEGRARISQGLEIDNGVCSYDNSNIRFFNAPGGDIGVNYAISYSPFTDLIQQSIIATAPGDVSALDLSATRAVAPYFGFYQSAPSSYEQNGYFTPTIARSATSTFTDPDETEVTSQISFRFEDGFDNKIAVIEFQTDNEFCTTENAEGEDELAVCQSGVTRAPARSECGSDFSSLDPDDFSQAEQGTLPPEFRDERGTNKEIWISIGGVNYKRFRVEVNYATQTVSAFGSTYLDRIENGIIRDADGELLSSAEKDPLYLDDSTQCEQIAVLEEIVAATGEAARVTAIPDPMYDVERDDDGVIVSEPTPLFSYQGTAILERQ